MEAEYARSVKQSILDYVLLDPAEQRRLGLHMPLPVSLNIFHLNVGLFERTHCKVPFFLYITHSQIVKNLLLDFLGSLGSLCLLTIFVT